MRIGCRGSEEKGGNRGNHSEVANVFEKDVVKGVGAKARSIAGKDLYTMACWAFCLLSP